METKDFIEKYKYNIDLYNKNGYSIFDLEDLKRFFELGEMLSPSDLFEEYDQSLDQDNTCFRITEFFKNIFWRLKEKHIVLEDIVYITYYAIDSFFIKFENNPKNFHFNTRGKCVGMYIVEPTDSSNI